MAVVNRGPAIVVMGGGTGTYTILKALKHYARHVSAVVSMADSGGSTGSLRFDYGVMPPGDIRQCLVALSEVGSARNLFNFRFGPGSVEGHTLGNLFLAAAELDAGSFTAAVALASELLRTAGGVLPVSDRAATLCAQGVDGEEIRGEHDVVTTKLARYPKVWLDPPAPITPQVAEAIDDADMIVVAPGNLYGSLAGVLGAEGMGEALKASTGLKICVTNLTTVPGQTDGFDASVVAEEICRLAGADFLTHVLFNSEFPTTAPPGPAGTGWVYPPPTVHTYPAFIPARLLDSSPVVANMSDKMANTRSAIRHNGHAVSRELMRIFYT